jgi:hypothetical protein
MRTGPVCHVDDPYTDHTRYDKQKSPNAGRKGDPGGPEYSQLKVVNGKPELMNKDGKPGTPAARTTSSRTRVSRSMTRASSPATKSRRTRATR